MRFARIVTPLAFLALVTTPAFAWDGGALDSSAEKALRAGDPAQAVADLRRATRSVLMPDVLEPAFKHKLSRAHVAWLAKLATRAEALPTPEAFRKVLAIRDEARRVKLEPDDQKVIDASMTRISARVWDELVAPPHDAGDLETALREARALRYATGRSEPREAALLQGIRSRIERLAGPGSSWLRQLLAHYYLRDPDPTPLFPYEGSRVTKLDVAEGRCAGIAPPLRAGANAANKGTAVAAALSLVSCTVQTSTRAGEKRLPYKKEIETQRNFKVPREVTYACKIPKVGQQCVTSSYTSQMLDESGRLSRLTETHSRTGCFPTFTEEDSTCRETVEEYVTTTHKEIREEVELVPIEIKRTSLVVKVTGAISVDGIEYPSKLEASPFYEEESYTSLHSANQTYGSLRRDELDKRAAAELVVQLGESARRAIFERKAVALEAELAAEGSTDGPKRTERLTSIAFYRHAPPKELLTQMATTTAFAEASLLRAFEEGQIADRALTTADAGDWLKLPAPSRDAESEVFVDEERSLVVDKFSGISTTALVTLGGHGGVGSPVYPTLGVVLRWDWTPSFLLLRAVSGSVFARPEGGMGPGNGFGYYGAQGGLSMTARTGPLSLQGMGMGGIDGRFLYGEGDDAGRPSMEVPASGFLGYGATLAVSGSRVIDHRLAVTVMRKHRVEHTYPFSNTLEVIYGRGYHVGVHAEVWGDVLTSSVAHLPLSTWLAFGGSLDLGAAAVGDVVEASEHKKD